MANGSVRNEHPRYRALREDRDYWKKRAQDSTRNNFWIDAVIVLVGYAVVITAILIVWNM